MPISGSPFTISKAISPPQTSRIVSQPITIEHKAVLHTPERRGDASRLTRVKSPAMILAEQQIEDEEIRNEKENF